MYLLTTVDVGVASLVLAVKVGTICTTLFHLFSNKLGQLNSYTTNFGIRV